VSDLLPKQTKDDGFLLISKLSNKHNLSNECIDDLLSVIQQAKTSNIEFPSSYYNYEKGLKLEDWKVKYHWLCRGCGEEFSWELFDKPFNRITCRACNESPKPNEDHFISFDTSTLLKRTVESHSQYMFTSSETGSDLLRSVAYQKLQAKGMKKGDISLVINTDGAPLFSSSKVSFWPILMQINESESVCRKRTVVMAGLWIGKEKPQFEPFLKRFVDDLITLQTIGFEWFHKIENKIYKSNVYLLCTMCDSIARPSVQFMSQFNASYGCPYCLHKEPLWYFTHRESSAIKRTHDEHLKHCEQATLERQTSLSGNVFGVKGYSPLHRLLYFDLILGFPPDIMHAVYLGVSRQLMKIWLADGMKFLSNFAQGKINEFLQTIKPPYRVSRVPRSLEHHKEFKAHEWSMWMYYYSPIILGSILPKEYYEHWMFIVIGLSILTCSALNGTKILKAKNYLDRFSKNMDRLYGHSNCTFNVHLLTHLTDFAEEYGPLQNISMFAFEDFNSSILSYVKGTQHVSSQVAKRYVQQLISKSISEDVVLEVKVELFNRFEKQLSDEEKVMLSTKYSSEDIDACAFHKRVKIGKRLFHSLSYQRVVKRNSSVVFFKLDNKVLEIEYFLRIGSNNDILGVGLLHEIRNLSGSILAELDYFYESRNSYQYFVNMCDVQSIALLVEHENKKYFIKFINDVENHSQ